MAKQVNGFIAFDGQFFENEAECKRYEAEEAIRVLCNSNEINPVNFFALINEWNGEIKEYYDADEHCEARKATRTGNLVYEADLSQAEVDPPDPPIGDKDAPGFLELAARGHIGLSDLGGGPRTEAIPATRTRTRPRSG